MFWFNHRDDALKVSPHLPRCECGVYQGMNLGALSEVTVKPLIELPAAIYPSRGGK